MSDPEIWVDRMLINGHIPRGVGGGGWGNTPVRPLLQSRMASRAILQNPTLFFEQVPIRSWHAGMHNYELECFRDATYKIRFALQGRRAEKDIFLIS